MIEKGGLLIHDHSTDLSVMLPPRSDWPRPGAKRRKRAQEDGTDALLTVLSDDIMKQWSTPNRQAPEWLRRLRRFVAGVRRSILEEHTTWSFESPAVRAGFKKQEEGVCKFRALAQFNLRDGLISSCVAYYFRKNCDPIFDESSFAFRAPSDGPPRTHHDAVEKLIEFRGKNRKHLWVAEVDIRGFFDVLGHDTVRSAVERLEQRLTQRFDQRAKHILWSYLACYSFNAFAQKEALRHARSGRMKQKCAKFEVPWPEPQLKELGRATRSEPIGIPQGGALSCFVANAVLDAADEAVRHVTPSSGALYMRYCDDVVLCGTNRATCKRMLRAYQTALKQLKLPAHPLMLFAERYRSHARTFWGYKSKDLYKWSSDDYPACVPWCSFVGYQVNVDRTLRIRKDSMTKAFLRHSNQVKSVSMVVRMMRKRGKNTLSDRQVMYRTRQRLRSSAVGTTLMHMGNSPSAISWAGGFRLLRSHVNPILLAQLRSLDRHKGKVLKRLKRALANAPIRHNPLAPAQKAARFLRFEGRPYSYAAIAISRR